MNKLIRTATKPLKPPQPAKPTESRLSPYRRLAIWRRGTLVLVP